MWCIHAISLHIRQDQETGKLSLQIPCVYHLLNSCGMSLATLLLIDIYFHPALWDLRLIDERFPWISSIMRNLHGSFFQYSLAAWAPDHLHVVLLAITLKWEGKPFSFVSNSSKFTWWVFSKFPKIFSYFKKHKDKYGPYESEVTDEKLRTLLPTDL